jgi:hypothetical protein
LKFAPKNLVELAKGKWLLMTTLHFKISPHSTVKKFSFYFTNTKYNHKIPQIRSYLWNMGQSRHKNNNPVVKRQINIKKQSSDNLLPKPRVRPGILWNLPKENGC